MCQENKFSKNHTNDLRRSTSFAGKKEDPNSEYASEIRRVLSVDIVNMSQPRCDRYGAVQSGKKFLPKPMLPLLPRHSHYHRPQVDLPSIKPSPGWDESFHPQADPHLLRHWIFSFSAETIGDTDPFGTRGANLIDVGLIIS